MKDEHFKTHEPEQSQAQHSHQPVTVEESNKEPDDLIVIRLKRRHLAIIVVMILSFAAGYLAHSLQDRAIPGTAAPALSQQGLDDTPAAPQPTAEPARMLPAAQPERVAVNTDDDPFLGPADAVVTIVEFSDYQCPFCKRFRDQTLDQILETYEGKVRLVYRDFPLEAIHPNAQEAAEATECADDQGQFWAFHDRLFADQSSWASSSNTAEVFTTYAEELGMDATQFGECLEAGTYADEVLADFSDGRAYGVSGTPTFFINGLRVSGAVPFSVFQEVIDAELAGSES